MGFGRCFWKGTSVSRLLQPCWCLVASWCMLIAGVPMGLSWPGVLGIMDLISSGGEQKVWGAQELQCQDAGKENINLGAAGRKREVVKVLSIICLCILLMRAMWEPKIPTEDGDHGKLSWEMQFPPIHIVSRGVRRIPAPALLQLGSITMKEQGEQEVRLEEGCGYTVMLCWLLSGCCQVGSWPWRGQFGHWSIHCHGSEPGWIRSRCQDL